ncbi:hypothetical protein RF11_04064 [Thelohanellus kitauei]|uniref:Uncharacterized protein n=1 Tax=Thelohanellus kitauei TaxID=669202 RepID=A0A0C2MPV9_THEKT|nr:hypothetical protein RF11_04064 [Thelohanellus kitauei]
MNQIGTFSKNADCGQHFQKWLNKEMIIKKLNWDPCLKLHHTDYDVLDEYRAQFISYLRNITKPDEYTRMIVSARCHFLKLLDDFEQIAVIGPKINNSFLMNIFQYLPMFTSESYSNPHVYIDAPIRLILELVHTNLFLPEIVKCRAEKLTNETIRKIIGSRVNLYKTLKKPSQREKKVTFARICMFTILGIGITIEIVMFYPFDV